MTQVQTGPLSEFTTILILHLLSDVRGFLDALLRLGLDPSRTVVLNIPYSTKPDTVAAIWVRGFRHLFLSADYPIDPALADAVALAGEISATTGTRILVIEDGGYAGPFIHRSRPDLLDRLHGVVEQTQNGIWQYEGDAELGIDAVVPVVPVMNVAESELKKDLESPLIGEAVHFNIVSLVRDIGYKISHMKTVILGYGATGSRVAAHFQDAHRDNPPRIYDRDNVRREQARADEFEVIEDLEGACHDVELLIGCTGKDSVNADVLLGLRSHCYFANGSSKRKELDWNAVNALEVASEVLADGAGRKITLTGGHELTLLADGYPVNFAGESVPDEEIAFVYGLLLRSALLLVTEDLGPGFHEIPATLQAEIRRDHFRMLDRPDPEGERN